VLNSADFDMCLNSGRYERRVKADENAGQKLGISGTPSFAIGTERL
jgi:protein-disulfide isomerase